MVGLSRSSRVKGSRQIPPPGLSTSYTERSTHELGVIPANLSFKRTAILRREHQRGSALRGPSLYFPKHRPSRSALPGRSESKDQRSKIELPRTARTRRATELP